MTNVKHKGVTKSLALLEEPRFHLINLASQVWITSPMWNGEQGKKVEMGLPFIFSSMQMLGSRPALYKKTAQ